MHTESSVASTEPTFDPALLLGRCGTCRIGYIRRSIRWRTIEFDRLTGIVGDISLDRRRGNSVWSVVAIGRAIGRKWLLRGSLVVPHVIGVRIVNAVVFGLAKLMKLIERAVLRAWVGGFSEVIRSRGHGLIRLLVGVGRNGTFTVLVAVLITVLIAGLRSRAVVGVRMLTHVSSIHLGSSGRFLDSALRTKAIRGIAVIASTRRWTRSLRRIAAV